MDHRKKIDRQRERRRWRVRKRLRGTADQPRLSVARSHQHISAQIIDDEQGKTIVAASSQDKTLAKKIKYGGNKEAAAVIGEAIAQRAVGAGITKVCFDRGPFRYHGRVAALADAARGAGLSF